MKPLIGFAIFTSSMLAGLSGSALALDTAQQTPAAGTPPPAASDSADKAAKTEIVLTPEELAEKESRKACKIDICTAFRNPSAAGKDVSCSVIKSWRKEQLVKMVSKLKVSWPYGPVRCTSQVNLKHADLVKALSDGKHETQLEKHTVTCSLDTTTADAKQLKFEFTPKVVFEKGKATSAKMNWGKIEAPALIKSGMWTATAADNTVNMLSGTLVEDINDFITNKCDEVKDEWSTRK